MRLIKYYLRFSSLLSPVGLQQSEQDLTNLLRWSSKRCAHHLAHFAIFRHGNLALDIRFIDDETEIFAWNVGGQVLVKIAYSVSQRQSPTGQFGTVAVCTCEQRLHFRP